MLHHPERFTPSDSLLTMQTLTPRGRAQEVALTTRSRQSDDSTRPLVVDSVTTPGRKVPTNGDVSEREYPPLPTFGDEEITLDVVQFSAPIFYTDSHETSVTVDVMRIGKMEGSCSVSFKTLDGSAKAGVEYCASSSNITFEEGEDLKAIKIPLVDARAWSTTSEMKIKLDCAKGCVLGSYLHTCRVKLMRMDVFPSSRFAPKDPEATSGNEAGPEEKNNPWQLYFATIGLLFNVWEIRWRTILTILVEQTYNMYLFVTLSLNMYMVDEIFGEPEERRRRLEEVVEEEGGEGSEEMNQSAKIGILLTIAFMWLAPAIVLQILEFFKINMNVMGKVGTFLKKHLVNQFLNYTPESRDEIGDTRLQGVIIDEVQEVAKSYMLFMEMLQLGGKAVVLGVFVYKEDKGAFLWALGMPVIMFVFAMFRSGLLSVATKAFVEKQLLVRRFIQETCVNFGLVASYQQRPRMNDLFLHAQAEVGAAGLKVRQTMCTNSSFSNILGPLFISMHIAIHGPKVLDGTLSLGTFLATIAVFKEFSEVYGEAYGVYLEIQSCLTPLQSLTQCFNMPLDLAERKTLNRMRRRLLNEARARLRKSDAVASTPAEGPRTDRVDIFISDLSWSYKGHEVLKKVHMTISQGTIIGICGPHGSGKSTLMQLMGTTLIPKSGTIFTPSHLRVLYVPEELVLFGLSAWANLTFGFPYAHPNRVKDILIGLGMTRTLDLVKEDLRAIGREQELWENIQDKDFLPGHNESANAMAGSTFTDEVHKWQDILSTSEKMKVSIVRALITNPEVLIMQRPTSSYQQDDKERIMGALRENIDNRGYKLPEKKIRYRRPRTLVMSSSTRQELTWADHIWEMDEKTHSAFESDLEKAWQRQENRHEDMKAVTSSARGRRNSLLSPNSPRSPKSVSPRSEGADAVTSSVGELRYPRGHFLPRSAIAYTRIQ